LSVLLLGQLGADTSKDADYKWIFVNYDGVRFPVWGHRDSKGQVVWSGEDPENLNQYNMAKAAKKPPFGLFTDGVDPTKLAKTDQYHVASEAARLFAEHIREYEGASDHLFVTIIGDDEERKHVVKDIATHPEFNTIRSRLVVQDFAPHDWQVDPQLGFVNGKPAIYVQTSKGIGDPRGGRVVFRANDYSIGAAGLAEAIRKADPNYKPVNDPTPDSPLAVGVLDNGTAVLIGAGLLLMVVFLPKKGS
jgi:hypothetical protein